MALNELNELNAYSILTKISNEKISMTKKFDAKGSV